MLEMLLYSPEEIPSGNDYVLKQTLANQSVLWTVPEDVYSICVVCVGHGAMGGGGLSWKNDILVTPGEILFLRLIASTASTTGQTTIQRSDSSVSCQAIAGRWTNNTNVGVAGGQGGKAANAINDGGGNGGNGYRGSTGSRLAGGGAGGYLGNGGAGVSNTTTTTAGDAGSGSGSGARSLNDSTWVNKGGDVGLYGIGVTGANVVGGVSVNGNDGSPGKVMCGGGGGNITTVFNGGIRIIWGTGYSYPNYAVEREPVLVPIMAGENSPSNYRVTGSSQYAGLALYPYMVFSRNLQLPNNVAGWAAQGSTNNVTGVVNEWLMVEIPEPEIVKRYSIKSTGSTQGIVDYQIQGSNDGIDFDVLDTKVDRPANILGVLTEYTIPNTTAYKYYRIHITKISKGTNLRITHLNYYTE